MDETTQRALQTAYQLIKDGKRDTAFSLLVSLIKANPNIADAWYLMGFAVTDPQKRLYAFQQVLRIDPNHQAAQKQIAKLLAPAPLPTPEAESKPQAQPVQTPRPTPPAAAPKKPAQKKAVPARLWLGIGAAVLLICVVGGVALAALSGSIPALRKADPTRVFPTSAPAQPTMIPTPTPVYTATFHVKPCPFDVPLGKRVRCGVVKVPQNREKNETDLIELPVVVYQSSKPNADVLIYLQGGPGSESIDWSLALFNNYVTPFLENYDMVFFDPRGTGRSEPRLDCPELNEIYIEAYFQTRSEEEAFNKFSEAWGKCHKRFVSEGIDPGAFNTTQSAADVRDIARALGYEKVNLLGISYGTRLALTIMRDYPEIVRSAIIDSVVPMERSMFSSRADDVQYAMDKMFNDCANSPRCNGAYPDLRNKFNELIQRFDENPVQVKIQDPSTGFVATIPVNGVDMVSAVVAGMHTSQLVPVIPKAIYDIEKGDYTFLSFALGASGGSYDSLSMGTYFATACHEQVYFTTAADMDAALAATSPILRKFSLAAIFGDTKRVFQLCDAWGAEPYNPKDRLPVKANIPTLIISGQYDPTTPVTTGEMVAADLPDHYFYVIPGMGHGATVGNDCAMKIVMGFLGDPATEPDHRCLDDIKSFEFFLPYDGHAVAFNSFVEPNLGLRVVVPQGWKKVDVNPVYYRRAYLFDPTLAWFTSLSATKENAIRMISSSFENSGFDETPKKIDTHAANGYNWTIYQTKYNGEPVFVALAEASSYRTMVLVMVVSAPEKDSSYTGLFLPMVDKLVPLQ